MKNRFRLPLLIAGLVGAVIVALGVVFVLRSGKADTVQIAVAIQDVPAGSAVDSTLFRRETVAGLKPQTLAAYVTVAEFSAYEGFPLLETVPANAPLLKSQVRTDDPNMRQNRLTLLLSDPANLVYPIPAGADLVGNYIVAGDRVDVIFSLSRMAQSELIHTETITATDGVTGTAHTATPTPLPAGSVVTTTLHLPIAKVILPDVLVLRVEREQIRSSSTSFGMGTEEEARPVEGDVLRLYLEVTREQAEILSFAVNNGTLNLPARAEPAGGHSDGFTWDDFVERFFEERE
jgi:Flp pilus assembly protein CpaB